jgi:hypothetical protein
MCGMSSCVLARLAAFGFFILAACVLVSLSSLSKASAEARLAMAPQPEKQKCITVGDQRICFEEGAKKCIKIGGKRICLEHEDGGGADKQTGPATTPAPAPAPAGGECQLCSSKGECSAAGNEAECAQRKATAEQMTVEPFLKWSCVWGGAGGGGGGAGGGGAGGRPGAEARCSHAWTVRRRRGARGCLKPRTDRRRLRQMQGAPAKIFRR